MQRRKEREPSLRHSNLRRKGGTSRALSLSLLYIYITGLRRKGGTSVLLPPLRSSFGPSFTVLLGPPSSFTVLLCPPSVPRSSFLLYLLGPPSLPSVPRSSFGSSFTSNKCKRHIESVSKASICCIFTHIARRERERESEKEREMRKCAPASRRA